QQEERIQQEKAYHSYYPPEDPKDAGYYSWKKDVKKCGNKLKVIFAYLCGESQLDKTENPKERAWNIWLTARSTLLTAVLQGTFELQNSGELGVCANRANDAKKSFTEDKDAEWKDMDDASQLCGEMRVRMFAQKLNKASLQKGKGADSSETQ
ncbi:MAG: hypothetical protein L6R42_009912, partial [Xanthoria sp. 1 TBL-2021]